MTRVTSLLLLLLLVVAAGCASSSGSGGATEEPTPEPTPEPTLTEPSSGAFPSFGDGAGDLASLLPTVVGGLTLEYSHTEGQEIFGSEETSAEAQAFLENVGAEPDDISMAFGLAFEAAPSDPAGMTGVSILALRVEGKDEGTLRDAYIQAIEAEGSTPVGEEMTVGGKSVTAIGFEGGTSGYLYVHDDVVYLVSGEPIELAGEALEALP